MPARSLGYASFPLALIALALSIYNTVEINKRPTTDAAESLVSKAIEAIPQPEVETEDVFQSKVERAIEKIVVKRRAEESTRNMNDASAGSVADLDASGMLSINKDGQVVYGNPDAEISIYTFVDFRCSFCSKYHPVMQQYINDREGAVNWIYKPYPVLGPASDQLARAAECVVREEGAEAYWRFSKLAYSTGNWSVAVSRSDLKDTDNVRSCVEENRHGNVITQSLAEGRSLNITGTPASLVRNNKTEQGVISPGFMQADQIDQLVAEVLQ